MSCLRANADFLEDELENVALAEDERTKKNNELKIKRRDYTGYDDDEFAPGHAGMKRSVLSKYDEFLEGEKETVSELSNESVMDFDSHSRGSVLEALHHPPNPSVQIEKPQLLLSISLCYPLITPVRDGMPLTY